MNYKIQYTEQARCDLKNIYEYIAVTLIAPETAAVQVQKIMKEIRKLDDMPLRFKVYEEEPWHSKGLRFFSVDNFLVFYLPEEMNHTVYVVRIMYSGRDVKREFS